MSQESSSNSTAIVAIVVVTFVAIAGFIAYQSEMFGEKEKAGVDIEFNMKK